MSSTLMVPAALNNTQSVVEILSSIENNSSRTALMVLVVILIFLCQVHLVDTEFLQLTSHTAHMHRMITCKTSKACVDHMSVANRQVHLYFLVQ